MLSNVNQSYAPLNSALFNMMNAGQRTQNPTGLSMFSPQINCTCSSQTNGSPLQFMTSMLQQVFNLVGSLVSGLVQLVTGNNTYSGSQLRSFNDFTNLPLNGSAFSLPPINELELPGSGFLSGASSFLDKLRKGTGIFQETLGNIGSLFGLSDKGGILSGLSKLF